MRTRLLWIALIIVALFAGVFSLSIPAAPTWAQGDAGFVSTVTPQPSPTGNGGNATWEIKNMTFQSNFPNGFSFEIEATSSGGKVALAEVLWRHSPVGRRTRRPGSLNEAGNKATARWEMTPGDAVPQWVEVEYWWRLVDEAGNTFETPRSFAEYADTRHNWKRAESQDIVVIWQEGVPDEVGPLTLAAMEQQRPFYERNWPKPLGYRPRAIIYADFDTWAEWAPGRGTTAGGVVAVGTTRDAWGATVQVYLPRADGSGPVEVAYGTVVHEVAHLYQAANGGSTVGDFWFFEGNATYFELIDQTRGINRVRRLASSGQLPSLQGGGPSARGAFARDAYDIGYMFFLWLEEAYGPKAHYEVWRLIGAGRSWKDALQTVTTLNFIDMETQFRTWLGAVNAVAPTPIPEPTLFFFPSPTYEPTPIR